MIFNIEKMRLKDVSSIQPIMGFRKICTYPPPPHQNSPVNGSSFRTDQKMFPQPSGNFNVLFLILGLCDNRKQRTSPRGYWDVQIEATPIGSSRCGLIRRNAASATTASAPALSNWIPVERSFESVQNWAGYVGPDLFWYFSRPCPCIVMRQVPAIAPQVPEWCRRCSWAVSFSKLRLEGEAGRGGGSFSSYLPFYAFPSNVRKISKNQTF